MAQSPYQAFALIWPCSLMGEVCCQVVDAVLENEVQPVQHAAVRWVVEEDLHPALESYGLSREFRICGLSPSLASTMDWQASGLLLTTRWA